jgi:opacity protein-like surface antigen
MLLPHWSVFFEYGYIGLSTHATTFTPTPPTTAPFVYNIKQDVHTVLAGANYRF